MKKIRFSSIPFSAAVVLIIFIMALNFYKKEPIYSYTLSPKEYTLSPKEPYITKDDNSKSEDIITPEAEQTNIDTDNIITENNEFEEPSPQVNKPEGVFYYTKTGTKWHSSKACRYLAKSKEIYESSVDMIEESGLSACSACTRTSMNIQNNNSNENINNNENNIINVYYYTESGTKWHLDKECRYIKNSKKIYEGDYKTVEGKGLSPCSNCAQ